MRFFQIFGRMSRSKEIGSLTDFLVGNPTFRNLALGFHKQKQSLFSNVEAYLDKEILGQDYKRKEETQRLNTKARNSD